MSKKILLGLFLLVFGLSGCGVNINNQDKRFKIVATIFPLADIAGNIGGGLVATDYLISPGVSEHLYEPKPSDVAKLTNADLVLVVGASMDDWVIKMMKNSGMDESKIVDVSTLVTLRKSSEVDETGSDPHYWLSPKRVLELSDKLEQKMAEKDVAHKSDYEKNLVKYKESLNALDQEFQSKINSWPKKEIVTFHDAFHYLADDYGLKVVGVIEQTPGTEPSPQQIIDIENQVKDMNIKAIFSEPQLSAKITDSLKNDLGIEIGILDPLGGIEGRMSYIGLMKYNLLEMGRFLG